MKRSSPELWCVLAAALIAAGCSKDPKPTPAVKPDAKPLVAVDAATAAVAPTPTPTPTPDAAAAPAGFAPACRGANYTIWQSLHRMRVAASPAGPRKQALDDWRAVDAACHDGGYHVVTAIMKQQGLLEDADVAGTREEILAAGLAVDPASPALLAYVALVSGAGSKPELPADACEKLTASADDDEARAYVCAHAALRAGDGVAALAALEKVDAAQFLDVHLRRVQALHLQGKPKDARKHAKAAKDQLVNPTAFVGDLTKAERDVLSAQLDAFIKG
jgi:hypothetical protein